MSKTTHQIEQFFGSKALALLKHLAQISYLKERMRLLEKNLEELKKNSKSTSHERVQKAYFLKDELESKEKDYRQLKEELERLKEFSIELQTRICSGTHRLNAILFSVFSQNILSLKELREKLKATQEGIEQKQGLYKLLKQEIEELKVTVYQMDKPQQDIDFAIQTLETNKSEILTELSQLDMKINDFLKDFCSNLPLDFMEKSTEKNPEIMRTLWQIADDSRELEIIAELIKRQPSVPAKQSLAKIHKDGTILPKTLICTKQLPITGRGTHHRKVSRGTGENRRSYWKVFQVDFEDSLKVKSKIKSTQFHKKSLIENVHEAIIYERQNAQNESLQKEQKQLSSELTKRVHEELKKLRESLAIDLKQI